MFTTMVVVISAMLCACDDAAQPWPVPGGDAKLGKRLIEQYQCAACHAIPGIAAAEGKTGPPLEGFGRRSYIAGRIPNLPDPLTRWLMDPPAMKPGTLMPNVGVSFAEARHMAAYLYTIK
jgi:cytochrome c